MQINRLLETVYILINKKNVTAKELSEHFEVSARTIYRDIEILSEAGIPIYANRGKGGGICLLDNFVLNKSVLTKDEQHEILTALQGIKAAGYPDTVPVLAKLSALFHATDPDWIEVDFTNWNSNEEDKYKFTELKAAVINRNVIHFNYFNTYGEESKRTVEPIKLVFRGQAWYLYGYCRARKDMRYFKITRIKNLATGSETFRLRPELTEKKNGEPPAHAFKMISLSFRADREMAYRIYDEFPPEAIIRETDGSFLIKTDLQYGGWLFGYLMSYEDHIEVIEPEYIRDELFKKYKNIINRYKI